MRRKRSCPPPSRLLVTPEQSKILAMLEADVTLHVSLVYRMAARKNAAKFTEAQDAVLSELYPDEPVDEVDNSSESEENSQPAAPQNAACGKRAA